ncbi:sensor histidine kinase [Actinocorallia sp. B10E7]|uniref:sensor histidine kinase n=1 Tax=Actinocorallia sp. B10E7 TaxID=3153558 RepID=UPI00325C7B4C
MALTHVALAYEDDEEFLESAFPFLNDGLEADDTVLAVTCEHKTSLLRERFGAQVRYVDRASFYEHPARVVSRVLHQMETAAEHGRRVRLLCEPEWSGRTAWETMEWLRLEALVNVALARTAGSVMCPYHRGLPEPVLDGARRTHPQLAQGGHSRDNPSYLDPAAFSAMCDLPLTPSPSHAAELPVRSRDLRDLRALVTAHARRLGLTGPSLHQLLVAVTEVATNALDHGAPPVLLRVWQEEDALLCEVDDRGHWRPSERPGPGWLPPRTSDSPRLGLWAVRMLCGLVQVRTGREGTRVRIRTPLNG